METNNIQEEIISILKKFNGLSTREIIKKCSFAPEQIKDVLNKLRDSKLISSSGETWQRKWYLICDNTFE